MITAVSHAAGPDPAHLTIINLDVPLPGLVHAIELNPPDAADHELGTLTG